MERALLVTVKVNHDRDTWDVVEREKELSDLSASAGARIIEQQACRIEKPTPDFYIGEGKAAEVADLAALEKIDIVIFNNDLSGTQKRNLEKLIGVKVIDRTQLILDIFSRRAKSPEGKAQVELAQLEYLLPRLVGRGQEFSRLGGGIGTRGPGEQKLEEDRRRIRDRIIKLKSELKSLRTRRKVLRDRRNEVSLPTVVFVGYTSAGKSTLFNALSGEEQVVSKKLFTTLDPLSRAVLLPNKQKVILSDTVGFIKHLPHNLVEAFKATLEDVSDADLLVHVLDASSPGAYDIYAAVCSVLDELGAANKEVLMAYNKIDLLSDRQYLDKILRMLPEGVCISALNKENLDVLLKKIEERLAYHRIDVALRLPLGRMEIVDLLYREGEVKDIAYTQEDIRVKATLPALIAEKLKAYSESD